MKSFQRPQNQSFCEFSNYDLGRFLGIPSLQDTLVNDHQYGVLSTK
ncbi:hypothetical protein [Maribacter cobaltidurans]|nr:hypothetical protein [Maribacter cobaltidurans]